ncbi:MAG: 23S rRNA (guanosine(2251)-2'-O)-methyltransferase RlmB, partial [Acidobacteria bacterium]|nr:23S rRNA (guanosine(2251)-2'-O)-methyltransferase RlmB [Acidobacteriota bacterium]
MHLIYGINSVSEALKTRGRAFEFVSIAKERHDLRLQRLIEECRRMGLPVRFMARAELDRLAGNVAHQGVVAVTSAKQYSDIDDVIAAKRGTYSLVVILDGLEDPHNLGAIIRTSDAAAADGLIIPERRAAGVSGTVTKVSSGATAHVPIARVSNVARTLQDLKTRNFWIVGLDERAPETYDSVDFNMNCALVLGSEGK